MHQGYSAQSPDLLDRAAGAFSAWKKERASTATYRDVNKQYAKRNDKTNADEALRVIWGVLVILAAFVGYCEYLYYDTTFATSFGSGAGFIFAVGLAAVTMVVMVYLTHLTLRALFFRWMFKDGWSMGYWGIIALLSIAVFVWSYRISTEGMHSYTTMHADEATRTASRTEYVSAATAALDKQIESATAARDAALNTKTKRGKTTWKGQENAGKASDELLLLQKQRDEAAAKANADYEASEGKRATKVDSFADFIQRFGGWGPWGILLCSLAVALAERRLFDANAQAEWDAKQRERREQEAAEQAGF
jgi:hypothetical protein